MKLNLASFASVGLACTAVAFSNSMIAFAQNNPNIDLPPFVETKRGILGLNNLLPESPYDREMRLAYEAIVREDYKEAIANFQNALALRPNDEYATAAYLNILDLINGTNEGPSRYDRYMKAGYQASGAGSYHLALIHFNKALQERPEDSYAMTAIGNIRSYLA